MDIKILRIDMRYMDSLALYITLISGSSRPSPLWPFTRVKFDKDDDAYNYT